MSVFDPTRTLSSAVSNVNGRYQYLPLVIGADQVVSTGATSERCFRLRRASAIPAWQERFLRPDTSRPDRQNESRAAPRRNICRLRPERIPAPPDGSDIRVSMHRRAYSCWARDSMLQFPSVPRIEQPRIAIKKIADLGFCLQFTRHDRHQNEAPKKGPRAFAGTRHLCSRPVKTM